MAGCSQSTRACFLGAGETGYLVKRILYRYEDLNADPNIPTKEGMTGHACNSSIEEVDTCRSLRLPGQPV